VTRFLLTRLGLALITLFLLSVFVFAISTILPGNVGRAVLGPFATQESVDALRAGDLLQGDLGTSLTKQVPVWDLLQPALENSLKLALVAFLLCIPVSIVGGVIAGLRYGRGTDKSITIAGISLSAQPEEGASLFTQLEYLLLPAMTLAIVLFGYIARITRAGMIEALESDYARTAYLKGLPSSVVVRKHVLRNALLPTIAVVAVQVGYLFGGLVAVEFLFNYQGIGALTNEAARQKDLPLLTSCVLVIGVLYLVVTLVADLLYALLNPRIRFGASE
jgi:peptide/nickel transport system permease protein